MPAEPRKSANDRGPECRQHRTGGARFRRRHQFIPARAGNTCRSDASGRALRFIPARAGNSECFKRRDCRAHGSSPRVRGTGGWSPRNSVPRWRGSFSAMSTESIAMVVSTGGPARMSRTVAHFVAISEASIPVQCLIMYFTKCGECHTLALTPLRYAFLLRILVLCPPT
jgi:hypothetical protein